MRHQSRRSTGSTGSDSAGSTAPQERGLSGGRTLVLIAMLLAAVWLLTGRRSSGPVGTAADVSALSALGAIEGYRPLPFSLLSSFEYEEGMPLSAYPAEVRASNGAKVAVHGFMLPLDVSREGVSIFLLNGSFDQCQFGLRSGAPHQWVEVVMPSGTLAPYTHEPITVIGTFSLGERRRNGRVVTVYRMAADRVLPV